MADRSHTTGGVLVLCPMKVERVAVERAVRAADARDVSVIQTGVGKRAILETLERESARARARLVVLAGVCGGLVGTEDVPGVARVVDEHGRGWTPSVAASGGVTIVGVDRIISTPGAKRLLAGRTGASIVDMEAHAFAESCERLGVAWAVVRGVSDTPEETLPGEVLGWIRPDGGTRALRAAVDMVMKPSLVPHVMGFARRMNRVLPEVGVAVVKVVREATASAERSNQQPLPSGRGSLVGERA